jgi:hypothetical protein
MFWSPGKTTDASTPSRSGMMFRPLTDAHGEAVLMSCLEASLVRTSAPQAREPESKESEVECGNTWHELSVKFDPASSSWKTHQCLWEEVLPWSSVTLPKWGLMRDGVLWERPAPDFVMNETDVGSWPTPQRVDYKGTTSGSEFGQRAHQFKVWTNGEAVTGTIYPNPDTYDALMGWPTGWTALSALATDKFQQWLRSHGVSSADHDSTQPHTPA